MASEEMYHTIVTHHILGAFSVEYAKPFFVLVAAILTSQGILQST